MSITIVFSYLTHHDDEALKNIQQPTWGSLLSQCKQRHTHTQREESERKINQPRKTRQHHTGQHPPQFLTKTTEKQQQQKPTETWAMVL